MAEAVYQIRNWRDIYETNETRKLKSLLWVKVPNKMDGLSFRLLAKHPDGATIFAAWVLMLQIASKADPRGILAHNGIPLSPGEMGEITGFPGEIFQKALDFLSTPKIGWIDKISPSPDAPGKNPDSPGFSPENPPVEEGRKEGMEEKEGSRRSRFTPPTFQEVLNYCRDRGNSVDPQKWMDHYTSNGWKVGKNPMKDWQAAVRTWEKSQGAFGAKQRPERHIDPSWGKSLV